MLNYLKTALSFKKGLYSMIYAALILFCCTQTLYAQTFGGASDFNLFSRNGVQLNNADIEGRAAAGGNSLIKDNYRIGYALSPLTTRNDLIVDGTLTTGWWMTMSAGSAVHSGVWSNGGTNGMFFGAPGSTRTQVASPINFNTIQTELTTRSTNWSNLIPNGAVSAVAGVVTLTGTDPKLNIFTLPSGFNVGAVTALQINIPVGSTILINYGGITPEFSAISDIKFTTSYWNGAAYTQIPTTYLGGREARAYSRNILWNFYQATTLTIRNMGWKGSIMAPNADFYTQSGHIDGQAMVKSASQDGTNPSDFQFNWFPFNGQVPCPSYPVVTATSNSPVTVGATINLTGGSSTTVLTNAIELINNGDFAYGWNEYSTDYAASNYSVVSNLSGLFGTGPNCGGRGNVGNLLGVNGNASATSKIIYGTLPVVNGTVYNLSFWAFDFAGGTNAARPQWYVNGALLGTYANLSGTTNCAAWVQNTATYTATSTGNIVFAIVDTKGIATKFALDDISIKYTSTNASAWSWTGPASFTSAVQSPTRASATAAMAGPYTLTRWANGCTNTATANVTIGTCTALTAAGAIGANQTTCGTSIDPAAFTETTAASGGSGTLEYQWQISLNNATWFDISGATAATYDASTITQTTYYRRGAKRLGCPTYLYSAAVSVTVKNITANAGADQTQCYNNAFAIAANTPPSGATGTWTIVSGTGVFAVTPATTPTNAITILPGNTVTLRYTVTDGASCTATDDVILSNTTACTTTCPATALNPNGDLETEGTATNFNLSLQSTPALFISSTSQPLGWEDRYSAGVTNLATWTGAFYIKKTGASGNPHSGTHYVYTKGSGICLSSLSTAYKVDCGRTYKFSVWIAAYSYTGAQASAPFRLEFAANSSTGSPLPYSTSIDQVAPASTSFNALNWQRYEFTVKVPTNGYEWSDFYFTSLDNTTGIMIDDVCITEVSAGSSAYAGVDQSSCNTSFSLNAVAPPGGYTGTWSVVSGNATIAAPTSPITTATLTSGTAATLRWYVQGNSSSCSSSDNMVIGNIAVSSVTVNSTSVCSGAPTTLTATGCTGTLLWSTGQTTNPITVIPTATNTYSVTCTSTPSANLLLNPSFEAATNFQNWDNWASSAITTVAGEIQSGTKAAKVDATTTAGGFGQSVACTPGEHFTVKFWARNTNVNAGSEVGMKFLNSSYTDITGEINTNIVSSVYQQYTVSGVAPPNAAFIQVYTWADIPSISYIDNITLTKAADCIGTGTVTVNICNYPCTDIAKLATPMFVNGDPLAGTASGASNGFMVFNYDDTGNPTNAAGATLPSKQMGAVWGTAYKSQNQKMYAGAFYKRHSGFGSLGLGGIYEITPQGVPRATPYINLTTLGVNVGTTTRTATAMPVNDANELATVPMEPSWDAGAFAAVGKRSLGGLDISDDGNTLYTMNLFEKKLTILNISGASPTLTSQVLVADPGCANGDYRSFAVKHYNGKVYVGTVCTGETSQNAADLKAYVQCYNGASWTTVSPAIALNFTRGFVGSPYVSGNASTPADWKPWHDTYSTICTDPQFAIYPQPILSDLEFDTDGSIILGFMDRNAHQVGGVNYTPTYPSTTYISAQSAGDIMRLCANGSSYTLENGAACNGGTATHSPLNGQGPGGGEYYWGDMTPWNVWVPNGGLHEEGTHGALAFKAGSGEIVTTSMNPTGALITGGVIALSNTTGQRTDQYQLYTGADQFGKASGLGDLEIFCTPAVQYGAIGNYVWLDANANGIADVGTENGINGVIVKLYKSTNAIVGDGDDVYVTETMTANDATTTRGFYYFPNLVSGNYYVQFQTTLPTNVFANTNILTKQTAAANTDNDSDANATTGNSNMIVINTALTGVDRYNYTIDAGYTAIAKVGNFVWNDTNGSGTFDEPTTAGINGVLVELWNTGADNVIGGGDDVLTATQTTANNASGFPGYYLFDKVTYGNYYVHFPTINGTNTLTLQTTTANTDLNSDADQTTGNTPVFLIDPMHWNAQFNNNMTLDAAYQGPCSISFTHTISNCNPNTNTYNITGTLTFINPPLNGSLGIDGYGSYIVINQPFTSPVNYTITGAIADGASHTLLAGFWNTTCDATPFTYTAPAPPVIAIAGITTITEGTSTTLTASGGTTYIWENATTNPVRTVSPVVTTSYTVTATNTTNNCAIPKTVNITVNPKYTCAATATQINGIVFQDINYNGTQDGVSEIGISGITVRAYNAAGTLVATQTTAANGTYTITGLTAATRYRIEFALPTWARPTQNNGTTNGTTVQFITAGSCAILGVANPDDYCQTDPNLSTAILKFGAANNTTTDAVVSIPTSNPFNAWADTLNQATIVSAAKNSAIGSTYGLAYKKDTKTLFTSAYIRRHAGLGAAGTGAIYKLDPSGVAVPTLFVNLNTIFGAGTTIADPHPYGTTVTCPNGGTPSNFSCWFNDVGAYNAVGRQGLADMDISEDGRFLYVMNMTDKTLYRIETANPTISGITKFPFPVTLPTATLGSATTNQIRPFGLGVHKGKVYAAAVNTEEDVAPTGGAYGGDYNYIYALDPTTATWTLVFEGSIQTHNVRCLQWPATFQDNGSDNYNKIISDIIFDSKDNMIIGVRDISADKFSEMGGKPIAGDNSAVYYGAYGNIIKASLNTTTNKYELENDGTVNGITSTSVRTGCGFPPTLSDSREFFHGDSFGADSYDIYELALGALGYSPVRDEVFGTMYDLTAVYTQGIAGFNNVTGDRDASYEINLDTRPLHFGKANGLGDMETLCNAAPLEIGNYVWADTDADGTQDANEYGIPNVQVRLYSRTGVLVGLTTTTTTGEYYFNYNNVDTTGVNSTTGAANTAFSGLSRTTPYYIVVGQGGSNLFNTSLGLLTANGNSYNLTPANTGAGTTPDQTDNDAVIATSINAAFNAFPYIRAVTGLAGSSDHSFDFGFKPMPSIVISADVADVCYDSNGATAGGTSLIDVKVMVEWANAPASNNIIVTVPNGGTQTINTATATSPRTLTFAVPTATPTSGNITASFTPTTSITATPIPLNIAASNCIETPCVAGSTGGTVWIDGNNNGIRETSETTGLQNVTVKAYNSANTLLATTTTDYLGQYVFSGLVPTAGAPIRIEFTNIPATYLLAEAGADNQGTIQFLKNTTCTANMAVFSAACGSVSYPTWLKKGYSVVSFLPDAGNVVLAVRDITKMGTLWNDPSNRNNNQGAAVPTVQTWTRAQFGNNKVYGITIDQRNGTIYVATSGIVGDQTHVGGYIFDSLVPARIYKISNLSSTPVLWATTPGSLGIGGIDIDTLHNRIFVSDIDNGKIYSFNTITAAQTDIYDPLLLDNGSAMRPPVLGDAVLGLGYNTAENKLYYSVWANNTKWDGIGYTRASANNNTIRSVALSSTGQIITASDQLEITLPFITTPASVNNYSEPVVDIEFSADGKKVLLAETAITEDAATPSRYSVAAHTTRVLEYQISGSAWALQPTIAGNLNSKYDLGQSSAVQYSGLNSRGGASWAYKNLVNGQISGNEDFVLMTGDALHLQSYDGDFIYGYQFTPSTGGNRDNSVLANFGLATGGKYTYGDVEILKGVPNCVSGIEIGNYVWRDLDSDGIQDANEPPIAGVDVLLKLGTTLVAKTKTDANGNYYFGGVANEGFTFESTTTSAQSITVPIPNTANDARQNTVDVINGAAGLLFNNRTLGLRFPNINIPKGATITNATIRFTASAAGTISNAVIKGVKNPDQATFTLGTLPFTGSLSDLFTNSATTANATWNAPTTWVLNASGADQTTPNLTAIVSEIVAMPAWERNKALAFVIQVPTNATGATAYDYTGDPAKAAVLSISFTGTTGTTGDSLKTNTTYTIEIPLAQTPITTNSLVPTVADSDASANGDSRDSDGTISGTNLIKVLTTPVRGANHTYDFGFTVCPLNNCGTVIYNKN